MAFLPTNCMKEETISLVNTNLSQTLDPRQSHTRSVAYDYKKDVEPLYREGAK